MPRCEVHRCIEDCLSDLSSSGRPVNRSRRGSPHSPPCSLSHASTCCHVTSFMAAQAITSQSRFTHRTCRTMASLEGAVRKQACKITNRIAVVQMIENKGLLLCACTTGSMSSSVTSSPLPFRFSAAPAQTGQVSQQHIETMAILLSLESDRRHSMVTCDRF